MRVSYLAALAVCGLSSVASAVVVDSNLRQPGDGFQGGGNILHGPDEISIGNVDQAQRFETGSFPVVVTSARLALNYFDGLNFTNVSIWSNVGGLPGTLLQNSSVSNVPNGGALMTAPFNLSLDANTTYWLVADAIADSEMAWLFNDIGEIGGKTGRSGDPVFPWNPVNPNNTDLAFEINGRIVPEPSGLAFLAPAALLLTRRRR